MTGAARLFQMSQGRYPLIIRAISDFGPRLNALSLSAARERRVALQGFDLPRVVGRVRLP